MLNVEELYQKRARRSDGDGTIQMRGAFRPAPLTYSGHVFEPDDTGPATVVIPVYDSHGIIDVVAVGPDVWGCISGAGQYLGTSADPLTVHRTPDSWIAGDTGILPLSKSFLRTMPSTATTV